MSASGSEPPEADTNTLIGAPQVSTVKQGAGVSQASTNPVQVTTPVPTNLFIGTLQGTLGFATVQIKVLVEDRYDIQESVLYWKFTDIK